MANIKHANSQNPTKDKSFVKEFKDPHEKSTKTGEPTKDLLNQRRNFMSPKVISSTPKLIEKASPIFKFMYSNPQLNRKLVANKKKKTRGKLEMYVKEVQFGVKARLESNRKAEDRGLSGQTRPAILSSSATTERA